MPRVVFWTGESFLDTQCSFWDGGNIFWMPIIFHETGGGGGGEGGPGGYWIFSGTFCLTDTEKICHPRPHRVMRFLVCAQGVAKKNHDAFEISSDRLGPSELTLKQRDSKPERDSVVYWKKT